jgi:hypothetical protein
MVFRGRVFQDAPAGGGRARADPFLVGQHQFRLRTTTLSHITHSRAWQGFSRTDHASPDINSTTKLLTQDTRGMSRN